MLELAVLNRVLLLPTVFVPRSTGMDASYRSVVVEVVRWFRKDASSIVLVLLFPEDSPELPTTTAASPAKALPTHKLGGGVPYPPYTSDDGNLTYC